MSEGLMLEMGGLLLLSGHHVDGGELERDVLLIENKRYALSAGRKGEPVKLENHGLMWEGSG